MLNGVPAGAAVSVFPQAATALASFELISQESMAVSWSLLPAAYPRKLQIGQVPPTPGVAGSGVPLAAQERAVKVPTGWLPVVGGNLKVSTVIASLFAVETETRAVRSW